MKLGIVGLSGAGKSTIFEALTKTASQSGSKEENRISTIHVPDQRVEMLTRLFNPKKTIYAQVEYLVPGASVYQQETTWNRVRDCDALIHVIKNINTYASALPTPYQDFLKLEEEIMFNDLVVVEKRLDRLALDQQRGVKTDPEEHALLSKCRQVLESGAPLRKHPDLALSPVLKGYAFLSAKPMLVLINNDDEDDRLPDEERLTSAESCMVVRGRLEHELAQMAEEEVQEFLEHYRIQDSAMDRVIRRSYDILGLISFFTVLNNEVRAWTIRKGTEALDAAGAIHSDMKKGFIRAEVITYEDLIDAGSYKEAKKRGTARLEGKTYVVRDGDIIQFRFNV
jgi:ribosome-binding ATPase